MDAKKNGAPVGAPNYHTNNNNTTTTTNQRVCEGKRRARKEYVETSLCEVLKAKVDFEDIKYARDTRPERAEREYMRIRDIFGSHITIDITDLELREILDIFCWVILNRLTDKDGRLPVPKGVVLDRQELRKIAPLFK